MFILRRSLSLARYKKELLAFAHFVITILITISLYSYNATDSSWFYYASHPTPIKNWCGIFGAYSASLFFFLLGVSAYCLMPLMLLGTYWLVWSDWRDEWERPCAGIILLMTLAALCTMHGITCNQEISAGGYVGYIIAEVSYRFFDRIGSFVLLYAIALASFIIMIRFSFIELVYRLYTVLFYGYKLIVRYQVKERCKKMVYATVRIITQPLLSLIRLNQQLFDEPPINDQPVQDSTQEVHIDDEHYFTPSTSTPEIPIEEPIHVQESITLDELSRAEEPLASQEIITMPTQATTESSSPYGLPSLAIFIGVKEKKDDKEYRNELEERARILEEKLERFGVYGTVVSIKTGPVVTLFEYQPNIDTKLSKILALEDDLALALQAMSIRILAPIPGRSVVGFEVANKDRKDVLFSQVIQSDEYEKSAVALPLILGKDTIGNNVVIDLAKMPHLLIAGSTGSGKSVALNAMLMSLLCKRTPDELKLILIDPKRLEFAPYADIAHLLFPIVTDAKRSIPILRWIVHQMEERYEKMALYSARNIFDYNEIAAARLESKLPYIVVIIDELSDLMLTVGREIEDVVLRITQMARAAGIHMIVATQRPSVDVITGLIKVNFPSRISFRVTSRVDSRTILDCGGADKLLGRGDMLFLDSTASVLRRIHGAYVSDREINLVISHIKSQQTVHYLDINDVSSIEGDILAAEDQTLYEQIVAYLHEVDEISISLLQRRFRIGYNRSARLIEMLEQRGLIMSADGGRTRRVIR